MIHNNKVPSYTMADIQDLEHRAHVSGACGYGIDYDRGVADSRRAVCSMLDRGFTEKHVALQYEAQRLEDRLREYLKAEAERKDQ